MATMIDTLRQEHADIARLLDLVEQQVDGEDAPDYGLLHEIAEYCLTYPDQYHHPKEDLIYQALCRHDPRATPAIADLEAEHEELTVLTREFETVIERARAKAADGDPRASDGLKQMARAFLDYYRQHIDQEESLFFPDAERMLGPEEWAEIEAQVSDPTDPLHRETVSLRLRALLERAAV
jgi:hemerythrin-like domain-containing protein